MRDMFRHQGWKIASAAAITSSPAKVKSHARESTMETKRHVVTIVVDDVEKAFNPVSELLHGYASHIMLRVGYPMRDKNVSVIFLVMDLDLDRLGAFSGKLGQIPCVKVKTITLKI